MRFKGSIALAGAGALVLGSASVALAQGSMGAPQPKSSLSPAMHTNSPRKHSLSASAASRHGGVTRGGGGRLSQPQIMKIQKALRRLGYYNRVDGVWGRVTTTHLKDLQYKNGLQVTGRPDAKTLQLLGLSFGSPSGMQREKHRPSSSTGGNSAVRNGQRPRRNAAASGTNGGARGALSRQQITQVQRSLNRMGYHVQVNGEWDRETRIAVRAVQKDNGIKISAKQPKMDTLRALGLVGTQAPAGSNLHGHSTKTVSGAPALSAGQTGKLTPPRAHHRGGARHTRLSQRQVAQIQRRLRRQGYQVGHDGIWDEQTRAAIARFQRRNGLQPTGFPDPATRKALGIAHAQWQAWAGSKPQGR